MLSTKLMRTFTLGLFLAAPAAMAGDAAAKMNCPAGTKPSGTKAEGLFCRKVSSQAGEYLLHGPYTSYHSNGQKSAEGQYEDGLKTGVWTFYDASGKEVGKTEFNRNTYHGQRVRYFASGKPQLVEEYQNGRKNGLTQEFSEDGKVVSQVRFENNRPVADK